MTYIPWMYYHILMTQWHRYRCCPHVSNVLHYYNSLFITHNILIHNHIHQRTCMTTCHWHRTINDLSDILLNKWWLFTPGCLYYCVLIMWLIANRLCVIQYLYICNNILLGPVYFNMRSHPYMLVSTYKGTCTYSSRLETNFNLITWKNINHTS